MADRKMSPRRQATEDFAARLLRVVMAVAGLTVVVVLCLQVWWEWVVPDLVPGAVAQGLVAPTLSAWTAVKAAGAAVLLSVAWRYAFCRPDAGGAEIPLLAAKLDAVLRHLGIDPEVVAETEVAALARAGKKIPAIALHRSATGADLATATAYVETLGREDGSPPPAPG